LRSERSEPFSWLRSERSERLETRDPRRLVSRRALVPRVLLNIDNGGVVLGLGLTFSSTASLGDGICGICRLGPGITSSLEGPDRAWEVT
jgi:hypothetical protein